MGKRNEGVQCSVVVAPTTIPPLWRWHSEQCAAARCCSSAAQWSSSTAPITGHGVTVPRRGSSRETRDQRRAELALMGTYGRLVPPTAQRALRGRGRRPGRLFGAGVGALLPLLGNSTSYYLGMIRLCLVPSCKNFEREFFYI